MNYICRLLILSYEDFGVTMSFGELTLLLMNCQSLSFHVSVAKIEANRQLSENRKAKISKIEIGGLKVTKSFSNSWQP